MPRVPSTRDVLPGARVNIVLKEDQPTGRTVVGVVQDVLTRGNHPRGIKVRLADGRVGRVQTMATGGEKTSFIPTTEQEQDDGPSTASQLFPRGPTDVRSDPVPTATVGLDAYIKPAKQKKSRRGKAGAAGASTSTEAGSSVVESAGDVGAGETTTCPVCENFEGDEAAVAHHVAAHFDN
ncbi:hypothetical protein QBC39DRAFT_255585 [Podospora conica]|nr:hypothetical protein QBC39DRAFT_255585 [Schizothecium conicum]